MQNYVVVGRQQGAVLIVGLIMLLLLTIIGLASIRGSDLQERMAGNMRDRNLAFQASEAALRVGEDTAKGRKNLSLPAVINTNGYWADLNIPFVGSPGRPVDWAANVWEDNSNSKKMVANTLEGIVDQPRYAIEQLRFQVDLAAEGSGVDFYTQQQAIEKIYYRVTSRGLGGTNSSEVILQSTVR